MSKKQNKILTIKPPVPVDLSPEAKKHWEEIVPILISDGVLCSVDLPLIRMACEVEANYEAAVKSQDLKAMKETISLYKSIMTSFGVTHKARQSMKIAQAAAVKTEGIRKVRKDFFDEE